MKETKYLPRKYCIILNALAVTSVVVAILSVLIDHLAAYLALAALLVLFTVLRFTLFRCPHCGKLMNVLPSKEISDGGKNMYCIHCGGEISFR